MTDLLLRIDGKFIYCIKKQWQNFDLRETKQIIYHLKGFDKSYPKMYFLLNMSHRVKSYGHLCQILACFTMRTHEIWSCHVTQVATFENFKLWPNFALTCRKSHQISSRKVLYFRSYQPKTSGGGGGKYPPPSAFRVSYQKNIKFF